MEYLVLKKTVGRKDDVPLTKLLPEAIARRKMNKLEESLETNLELVSKKDILTDKLIRERRKDRR